MNYNHLIYFQTLARCEHYRKAAEELHITQPSLSNAIHRLEEDLGVQLFEKSGRGVRLTKQGRRFLDYVDQGFHALQIGEELLHYEQIHAQTTLNLGVVLSIANDPFPDWIRGFTQYYPRKVFFSCVNDTSDGLCLELKAGNVDLIFCSKIEDPRIEFTPLFDQKLMLLVPLSHRLAGRSSIPIQELDGEAFIAHSRKTALHDILADIYRANHIRVRIVSEADEDRAIIGMVRAGLGCGVTTYSSELYGSGFQAIPITGSGFHGQICMGRRRGTPLPDTAQLFWDYLLSHGDRSAGSLQK